LTMKIYFAGPLFSEAERDWIRSTIFKIESLAARHGTKLEIIFPYEWMTAWLGRSDISTPKNHPNRKLSGSGLISAEQGRVMAP
jgi:hypothetical protein